MVNQALQGSLELNFYCTVFCNCIFWCPLRVEPILPCFHSLGCPFYNNSAFYSIVIRWICVFFFFTRIGWNTVLKQQFFNLWSSLLWERGREFYSSERTVGSWEIEGSKVHQMSCCDISYGFASYQRWICQAGIPVLALPLLVNTISRKIVENVLSP